MPERLRLDLSRWDLQVPFTRAFRHGSAVRSTTETIWVEARGGDHLGVGEGCPRHYVTGETLESTHEFFDRHRASVEAEVSSVETLSAWAARHEPEIDASPAAWCAIELAILDLLGQRAGRSVERRLGCPPVSGCFRYTAVVGDAEPEVTAALIERYRALGFEDFKLKLSGNLARDRAAVATVSRSDSGPTCRLRVDANNLWTDPVDAITHVHGLGCELTGIEEPLAPGDLDGLRRVAVETGVPVVLDESACRHAQLADLASDPARWIVNVRVSKMGGLLRSLALVEAARAMGLRLVVGAQVGETSVLTRAALPVARAAGDALVGQEGAFGTHLLQEDIVAAPLMFGPAGILEVDAGASERPGWGLALRSEAERRGLAPLQS